MDSLLFLVIIGAVGYFGYQKLFKSQDGSGIDAFNNLKEKAQNTLNPLAGGKTSLGSILARFSGSSSVKNNCVVAPYFARAERFSIVGNITKETFFEKFKENLLFVNPDCEIKPFKMKALPSGKAIWGDLDCLAIGYAHFHMLVGALEFSRTLKITSFLPTRLGTPGTFGLEGKGLIGEHNRPEFSAAWQNAQAVFFSSVNTIAKNTASKLGDLEKINEEIETESGVLGPV